jgi:hypothetical protein
MSNLIHISTTDLSDFYKDAHGFRPRHYKEWWTENELDHEYRHLSDTCKHNMEEEAIQQEHALVRFESLIKTTIEHGAKDRQTAIRWLIEGEDLDLNFSQDVEHFFWLQGISWEMIEKFKKELDINI